MLDFSKLENFRKFYMFRHITSPILLSETQVLKPLGQQETR